MVTEPTVFVVDDDPDVRESLSLLLKSVGLNAETFADAQGFLEGYRAARAGCLIVDVRMPGMSGLELQQTLTQQDICLPVIVITAHGDVPMAIRAMKAGAVDFIEKPYSSQTLLEQVHKALARDAEARRLQNQRQAIAALLARLTSREHEVLERVVAGQYNKVIAAELGISLPTVEARRKRIMEKLEARSFADLVHMVASHKANTGKP